MEHIHYGVCNFCDSACGLEIAFEGDKILSIRGDREDKFSRGHICPKGVAQQDLYNDPDRLRKPVRRNDGKWEEISWEEAYREAGRQISLIQKKYGHDAVGVYYGNPASHSYSSLLCLIPFIKGFKTRNLFSAVSVDSLTRMLVSLWMYGSQAILPIPDIERTDYFLVIGANPVVSNGSVMTAPDCRKRLLEIRARGGKIIVLDPRRTETAAISDAHYFIRPGTDAMFLLAFINTLFKEKLVKTGKMAPRVRGLDELEKCAEGFTPESVAEAVGIPAEDIKTLARQFAAANSAVCYGRMGTSTQEFGSLATWLIDVVNIVTGNMDKPGGYMFTTPAVDLVALSKFLRQPGVFNRWQSRVSGLPEFNGEFPVAALAEEMETPGKGQIKAFISLAGNPILSLPNGRRLDRAFENLEYMISIDFYINETSRHANLILPPVSPMECDHYPILELTMGIRNAARYAPALFPKPRDAKQDWEIQLDLVYHVEKNHGLLSAMIERSKYSVMKYFNPLKQLNLLLRFGPHKLSVEKLLKMPHGVDLGPLTPQMPKILNTPDRRVALVPELLKKDLDRLDKKLDSLKSRNRGELLLISRRTLRSINSWMHNSPRLVKGRNRCTLMMNPVDAERDGLKSGQNVLVSSRVGAISAPLELTDEMMPGVVSITFGWGHDREGSRLTEAAKHAGVSMNDITDEALFDRVSGISVLDGIPVTVTAAGATQ